jgi:hypothetical protein
MKLIMNIKRFIDTISDAYTLFFKLSLFKKSVTIAASLSIASAALYLLYSLPEIPLKYSEFIVGSSAWKSSGKTIDLLAGPFFAFVYILFHGVFSSALHKSGTAPANRKIENQSGHSFFNSLKEYLYWIIPFLVIDIFLTIKYRQFNEISNHYVALPALYALTLAVVSHLYASGRKKGDDHVPVHYTMLAACMFISIPAGITGIFKIFGIHYTGITWSLMYGWTLFILMIHSLGITIYRAQLMRNLFNILLTAQLLALLLLFHVIPSALTSSSGVFHYSYSGWLKVITVLLVAGGFIDTIRRYWKNRPTETKGLSIPVSLLSPLSIFALLIVLKMPLTVIPSVSSDDYHFGEMLIGGWSYTEGLTPYVDYLPAHGLFPDDFASLVNAFLFDGFGGSHNQAEILVFVLSGLLAFSALCYYFKNPVIPALMLLLFSWRLNWLILVPFLALWSENRLLKKSSLWIILYSITAPLLILLVPPQGGVLAASFFIFFIYHSYHVLKNRVPRELLAIGLVFTSLALVAYTTPLGSMFFAAVTYVAENAATNQQAYGIPLISSWQGISTTDIIVREVMRNSWVIILILSMLGIIKTVHRAEDKRSLLRYSAVTFFIILMISYAMGRIDPGKYSRPSILTAFSMFIILPFLFVKIKDGSAVHFKRNSFIIAVCLAFAAYFQYIPNLLEIKRTFFNIEIPGGKVLDGSRYGLNNLGNVLIEKEHFLRLHEVKNIVEKNSAPGETYWDLTNRNSHYFYLNRIPPVAITAHYNTVPLMQQMRTINEIDDKKIPLTLFAANNLVHDGGGVALRSPLLFRYAYLHYTLFHEGRILYGLRNDDPRLYSRSGVQNDSIKMHTESAHLHTIHIPDSLLWFEQALSTKFLKKIPISWGKSHALLQKRVTDVHDITDRAMQFSNVKKENSHYIITGQNPSVSFDLSALNLSGLQTGMLILQMDFSNFNSDPIIQIVYWGDDQHEYINENSLIFNAENGYLYIPFDTQMRWLKLAQVKGFRITVGNYKSQASFSIHSAQLGQRKIFSENGL